MCLSMQFLIHMVIKNACQKDTENHKKTFLPESGGIRRISMSPASC